MGWYHTASFIVVLVVAVKSIDLFDPNALLSTIPSECEEGYTCVKYFLCREGLALRNGSGLLTPREDASGCNGDRLSKCCRNPEMVKEKINIQQGETSVKCEEGYSCVKYFLCTEEDTILTNGSRLVTPREDSSCNGDPLSKCCRNPGAPKEKPNPCPVDESCVPYYLCDSDTGIVADGSRLLDARSDDNPCSKYLEVCCPHKSKKKSDQQVKPSRAGCGWRNKDGLYFGNKNSSPNQAKFGEFPWTVAILDESTGKDIFVCGGSLIHPSVVLTAAHSLSGTSGKLKVRAGEWDFQSSTEPLPHQDLKVSETIINHRYSEDTLINDIAILILKGSFELKDNVQPICLLPKDAKFDSQSCYKSGWDKSEFESPDSNQVILKKLQQSIIPNRMCEKLFRETRLGPFFQLDTSILCTDNSICTRDGGSPLVCPIAGFDERYYQVGIVSWGIDCGQKDVPEAYVSISEMRQWIEEELSRRYINFTYLNP